MKTTFTRQISLFVTTCVVTKKYAEALISLASEFNNRLRDFAAIEKDLLLFSFPFSVDPDGAN